MADISDPQIVVFTNEYLRPIAEKLRDAAMMFGDAKVEYLTRIAPLLAGYTNEDILQDGREAEGLAPVTKADLVALLGHIALVLDALEVADMDALRALFTVRPPRI